jgi:hypothetical protein
VENPNLSDTASAVLQLAKTLPYKDYEFSLFNDNLFNKPELFRQLRALRIGACGTARKDVTTLVFGDSLDTWKLAWGSLWSKINNPTNKDVDATLISAWQDSAIVRFITTIHTGTE